MLQPDICCKSNNAIDVKHLLYSIFSMNKNIPEDHFLFKMLTAVIVSNVCVAHYQTYYTSGNNIRDGITK